MVFQPKHGASRSENMMQHMYMNICVLKGVESHILWNLCSKLYFFKK
ncbi:hypothetical Protein YC6258_05340 [Gynuella sunshinyii YC6258]|uniref:Uncharacterized protein n=1 Tax=Gynuella sunshinyii YC6258 TaxID=1445510 RepID=A0A0C5VDF9_9GAMM|nr:hypothetical Protein YC6258_05340 [Gynuella sunshinyii YC6258]